MGFLKKLFGFGKKEEEKVDEEVNNEPTQTRNFKYLDDLIHSGVKEIFLDSDIVLGNGEEFDYKEGVKLDVDDLTIDGNGYAIDAQGLTRIFCCTGKNVIIKNIILKNGFSDLDKGGAIYNDEGELTITESTLQGNTAQWDGGAIYNRGELTITESTLTGNTAQWDGGAIHNYGEMTITETTFTKNTANQAGGAIHNWLGKLTITDSTLNNNAAESGAIFMWGGVIAITKSTLSGNAADLNGGAIYNMGGELTIADSTITENTSRRGGAIVLENSKKYESNNCTFKDNKPDDVYEPYLFK